MSDQQPGGIRARGEEALGELAQVLLDNPLFSQALSRTLGVGERAIAAQRSALSALDLPSAGEVEALERRIRSLSDRIETIEDALDSLTRDLAVLRKQETGGAKG